jgi:hypothetical protein
MDSPHSGAHHRALTIVDSVYIDFDRADYVAPDKAKFPLSSIDYYLFLLYRYSGAALCKLTLQVIDFAPRPR